MVTKSNKSANWQRLFDEYHLLETIHRDGYADITSQQIKDLDNLEPRLLGKIDHKENLPEVFAKNELSILTISNSAYRIGPFDIFQNLPEWRIPGSEVRKLPTPSTYETLNFRKLTSEPQVINAANVSEVLETFFGEKTELTISGKHRTPEFEFKVNLVGGGVQKLTVSKAQIEIDAGYEGTNAFYILEAKNHAASNFNLRQLYYPYRTWKSRIKKPVVPIFLTYSNDVFDFFKFEFEREDDFSSAHLTKHGRFMLSHESITTKDLDNLANVDLEELRPGDTPFPQADSFERVVDLVAILLDESSMTQNELAEHYAFDPRQSDYYWNAARYLGLANSEEGVDGVTLRVATERAHNIFSLEYREKYLALAKLVFSIPGVQDLYLEWRKNGKPSEVKARQLVEISKNGRSYSESTITRRMQTVIAWTNWLICLPKT